MGRRLVHIFIISFFLNLLWEEAHSVLYVSYQGETITHLILLRAALFDAAVITLFAYFCFYSPLTKGALRCGIGGGMSIFCFALDLFLFSVLLEKWALASNRWAYTDAMPLIPYLWVGLSPTLQLALTGFFAFWFANKNWIRPALTLNGHRVG